MNAETHVDVSTVEVPGEHPAILDIKGLDVYYGDFWAVRRVDMAIRANEITAFIGPSGCGKSTALRCINRTNDLVPSARVAGQILYHGQDLYGPDVDPIEVRRRVGMVALRRPAAAAVHRAGHRQQARDPAHG